MAITFGATLGPAPDPLVVAMAMMALLSAAAARTPLVVVVDDAQWLDAGTTETLSFIARRAEFVPTLLLVAARSGGGTFLAGIADTIETGPLDAASAEALLTQTAPGLSAATRRAISVLAAGNPLALVELSASPGNVDDAPLPPRLAHAFGSVAAALSPATRDLLRVAALDDGDNLAEIIAAAALLGDARPADVLPAIDHGVVTVEGGALRFNHPLVRAATRQAATPLERHAAHIALAVVLADAPDRRAWHRAASVVGVDPEVADDLEHAGERALARGAIESAMLSFRTSSALSRDHDLLARRLLRAADAAFELGRRDLVDALLAELGPRELSRVGAAHLLLVRLRFDDGLVQGPRRVARLTTAAAGALEEGATDLALELLTAAAARSWWGDIRGPTTDEVVALAERAGARGDDPRRLAILAWTDPEAHGAFVRDRLAPLAPRQVADGFGLGLYGMAATAAGAHDLAAGFLEAATAALRTTDRVSRLAQALTMRGWTSIHIGRFAAATRDLTEAVELSITARQPFWRTRAEAGLALLAAVRGEPDAVPMPELDGAAAAAARDISLAAATTSSPRVATASTRSGASSTPATRPFIAPGAPGRSATWRRARHSRATSRTHATCSRRSNVRATMAPRA